MHMVIYALVEASTAQEAIEAGSAVFARLVGTEPHARTAFDYFVTFDQHDTTVAGTARWGDLPPAAPVDSEIGSDLLEQGWATTTANFEQNLTQVKDALADLSDAEIMRNEELARHAFYRVGADRGPSIPLYDMYGHGIRHREQLDRVLDAHEDLWIVPADVHF